MERTITDNRGGNSQSRRTSLLVLMSVVLLAAVVLGAYLLQCPPKEGTPAAVSDARTAAVTIPIEGMSCAACVARVKQTLKSMDGVKRVEVRLAERDTRVRYDETRVTPERLAAAINKLSYKAGVPKAGG